MDDDDELMINIDSTSIDISKQDDNTINIEHDDGRGTRWMIILCPYSSLCFSS